MSNTAPKSDDAGKDVEIYLEKLRPKMLMFVQMQLGDEQLAEDLVQEAMLGAIKNSESFRGEAVFKTWVFSILKRKIADYLRNKKRAPTFQASVDQNLDLLFDARGRWHPSFRPALWGDPVQDLSNDQFWIIFDTCLNELPEKQCTIFMMREYIGLEPDEIRKTLGVSVNLVNVNLHRARLSLQQCLSIRWYGDKS